MSGALLRVAVAGAGYFARFHHQAWSRLDDARLVAVADLARDKAEAAVADLSGASAYADVGAMLDREAPDLLDIATPPDSHLALLREAAARGIPVVCQKPLAPSFEEAKRLVAAAEDAGIPLFVHENFRFQPWYREAARLLATGQLGTPHGIAFRLRPGDGQGPNAYLSRQPYFQHMPRFLVHETAIHFIDTFRFLLGEVSGVFARLRRINPAIAGEDAGYMLFQFRNGTTGLFDGNRLNDHPAEDTRLTMGEMWLEGSAGVLRLDGLGRLWWKPHGSAEAEHRYAWRRQGFAGDSVHALQGHIVAHLTQGAPVENTGRDYLRNLEIEEAVYRSAAEGRWQEV